MPRAAARVASGPLAPAELALSFGRRSFFVVVAASIPTPYPVSRVAPVGWGVVPRLKRRRLKRRFRNPAWQIRARMI